MIPVTPQEVFEYKRKWAPGVELYVHSDVESQVKDLAKTLFKRHQWNFVKWVAPYRHALQFETAEMAAKFKREAANKRLGQWVYDLPE